MLMYGVASIGATLNIHYCCGRIDKIALKAIADDRCPVKKAERKKGCCQNEQLQIKLSGLYQKTNEATYIAHVVEIAPVAHTVEWSSPTILNIYSTSFYRIIPPPLLSVPIQLVNCIFLI